jgi:hypothetical protein
MAALDFPKLLMEHNGSLSIEVNLHEPKVAEAFHLIPTPIYLEMNGRTSGPNYGQQTFGSLATAELDSQGRVVNEVLYEEGTKGCGSVEIERIWDGLDFTETVAVTGDHSTVPDGYRRTLDDGTSEVKYMGRVYKVSQRDNEDGSQILEAIRDDELTIRSQFDKNGKLLFETSARPGGRPRIISYIYDKPGDLSHEVTPGYLRVGSSDKPLDVMTTYETSADGRLVTVKRLPSPDSPNNPDMTEKRTYDANGVLTEIEIVDGFIDIGRLMMSKTMQYASVVTTV